jgi:hypothetical protein
MASPRVENLVNIATNLVKKKLALRESAPSLFETLQNIDDQIRAAANAVVDSGEEDQLTEEQIYLINSALVGIPRNALVNFETTYTPDDSDVVGELRDIKQVNFHNLDAVKRENRELYEQMVKAGIVKEEGKGGF